MGSKQESLNKRIRETISRLSDEDLANMQKASAQNYTPFARKVLDEELVRRRRIRVIEKDTPRVSDTATMPEQGSGTKNAGCYIEVWSDENFEGEYLRIEGPAEYNSLEFAGLDWGDSISSIRVGPSAFVLVYADREFNGTMMSFGPGQEVSNLEDLNLNDDIDSIRLVNSIKVFDEFRSEDVRKPASAPEKKRNKRKLRGG